ncbi:MAG: ATP-binding protein [Actinomycetota bacterium]
MTSGRTRTGVRLRIVGAVTGVFGVAAVVLAVALLSVVESQLVDERFEAAEADLNAYLAGLEVADGGDPAMATPAPVPSDLTSRVIVIDEFGRPVSTGGPPGSTAIQLVPIDDSASLVAGQIEEVDLGDDVAAVASSVSIGDEQFTITAANPLQPVLDSLDTVRTALWVALPVLIALVGGLTYCVSGRALRPVRAITSRVREIDDQRLAERVPEPAGSDEIRDLAVTMNGMLDRLETAQRRQRQLAADASHELRSPVAASRTQLEVALARPDDADWPATATAVLSETEHLGALIDDLLVLARLEADEHPAFVEVDLDDVVRTEAQRPHDVPVRVSIDRPVRISGVSNQVQRAIRNVVDNAARHASTAVDVALVGRDGWAVVTVDDDGPGIPEDDRQRVFDRFVRLDEARDRERGGAGLGLAIVAEVARTHGGDVQIGESPTGGAQVTLRFPT